MKKSDFLFFLPILFFGFLAFNTNVADASPAICEEAAAKAVIEYLERDEPLASFEISRASDGGITALIDKSGIYDELTFSAVHEEPYENSPSDSSSLDVRVYEFRNGDYIVFAKLIELGPSGLVSCKVLEVDSGQDDQD